MTQQEEIAKLDAQYRQLELSDIMEVASTQAGRRFLQRLFRSTYIFEPVCCFEETHKTAFNEGKRNVGLEFYNDLNKVAPEKMISIQREVREREEEYVRKLGRIADLADDGNED